MFSIVVAFMNPLFRNKMVAILARMAINYSDNGYRDEDGNELGAHWC